MLSPCRTAQCLLRSSRCCRRRQSCRWKCIFSPVYNGIRQMYKRLVILQRVPYIGRLLTHLCAIISRIYLIILLIYSYRKPLLVYLTCLSATASLFLNVYGFSTPWWVFIEGHYSEPCFHIQGLWDICIMRIRGEIDACENSLILEKENGPSSFVKSCGQRSLYGFSLSTVRVLETFGVTLATISEIIILQLCVTRTRKSTYVTNISILLLLLAGITTLAGVYLCTVEIEQFSRPDDMMYVEWSCYVSGIAGILHIVTSLLMTRQYDK